MRGENFNKAIGIIANNYDSEIIINHVNDVAGDILTNNTIHILRCNANVVNKLIEAGFSLSMDKNGMCVDDYGVK